MTTVKKRTLLNGRLLLWQQLLVALTFILLPLVSQASHIVGGDIGYRCLGNNQYEITLNIYRDCFYGGADAQFDNPASVGIFNPRTRTLLQELEIPFMRDDTLEAAFFDDCFFVPGDVCVHTSTYRDTVTLLPNLDGYEIVYQRCCRNQTIKNITEPDLTGATYNIIITRKALEVCNSSPRFREWPPIFICVNKPIFYDHSATDINGDSLVYRLCTPLSGATKDMPQPQPPHAPPYDSVNWVQPTYGLNNILGAGRELTINPANGFIVGRPALQGQFVVGVCVEEYRDGQLLSVTRRDFQYNVGMCRETVAEISAPQVQCDNLTVNFESLSQDYDTLVWNFNYPSVDPQFISREENPTFTFPDTGYYRVQLIADPGKTCADTVYHDLYLQRNSLAVGADINIYECIDTSILELRDVTIDSISSPVAWLWEVTHDTTTLTANVQNPRFFLPSDTEGTIRLTVQSENGCVQEKEFPFETGLNDPVDALLDTLSLCLGDTIGLNPNVDPDTDYRFRWRPALAINNPNIPNPLASPGVNITYTVRISPPNDLCQVEKNVTVIVQNPPQVSFEPVPICNGGLTRTFINTSTSTSTYEWLINGESVQDSTATDSTFTFTFPDTGRYEVMLIGSNGNCRDTFSQNIVVESAVFQPDFTAEYTSCINNRLTIRFFDRTVANGTNIEQREWQFSNGLTSFIANPQLIIDSSQVLTVHFIVTGENGCVDSISRVINIPVIDLDDLADSIRVCPGESVELFPGADTTFQYTWTPSIGLSDPNAPNPIVTPNETIRYMLAVTSIGADTCTLTKEVLVYVPPSFQVNAGTDTMTCADSVLLVGQGPDDALRFAWVTETGETLSTNERVTVPVSGVTTFIFQAQDIYQCVVSDSVQVVGGPPNLQPVGDQVGCEGDTLHVSVLNVDADSDTLTYQWFPAADIISGGNTANPEITLIPGERRFTVVAENQFGCIDSASVYVGIVPNNLELNFDSALQCDGITVNFTNTSIGGFNYLWLFGDTLNSTSSEINPSFTYPQPGLYNACLTLGFDLACVDTICQPIEIIEANLQAAFDFEYLTCSADSARIAFTDLSRSTFGDVSWLWQMGDSTISTEQNPIINFYESGPVTIKLTVSASNDCATSISQVLDIQVLDVDLQDTVMAICQGESVALNPNGNTEYLYLWTPADGLDNPTIANPSASPLQTTTYSVIIQSALESLCRIERAVTVQLADEIELGLPTEVSTCGDTIVLEVTPLPSTTYEWRDASGTVTIGDRVVVAENYSGYYYIEAFNETGCSTRDSVLVNNNIVSVQISGRDTILACEGQQVRLTAVNGRPEDLLTYSWTPTDRIIGDTNTSTILISTMTDTTLQFFVVAENQFGCTATDSVVVTVVDFEIGLPDDIQICANTPTELNPNFNPNFAYTWTPAAGLSDPKVGNPIVTLATSRIYRVQVEFNEGTAQCSEEKEVAVQVYPRLNLQTTGDTLLCESGTVTLSATADNPISYAWSDSLNFENLLSMTSTLTVMADTGRSTYYVMAENEFGCTDTSFIVIRNYPLELSVPEQIDFCMGSMPIQLEAENLNAEQTVTYSWGPAGSILSGANTATPTVNPSQTTNFTLTAANQFGCESTYTTRVNVVDLSADLTISARPDTIIPGGKSQLFVTPSPQYSYLWSPAESLDNNTISNPIAAPRQTTTYRVLVTLGECVGEENIEVVVRSGACEEPFIFVPSAFTPNNDGENDVLFVRGNPIDEVYFAIYNRWGEQVFETNSKDIGWDGTYQGKELPPDVFGYYLEVRCLDGEQFFKKGNITLLR